ncbi:MAG: glucose 1-dehydrogenase [Parachlamydiales bacterium]|nr:glucose 1-dehydrogenase [Parachlamydiales bacterium]
MKAIALQPGTKNLRLADWAEPTIQQPDQIKVKVLQVGICGTDREEASGGRADAPPGEKELIIGHEMVSQIVEVGSAVKNFKPQDHVVFTVRRGCNKCPACLAWRFDLCTTGNYTERGIRARHGFQSEFVVDSQDFAIPVPAELSKIAVMTEPMSVVEKAIDEASIIQTARIPYLNKGQDWLSGKTVLVAGLGPIGLLAAIILRLRGATVIGLDVVDDNSPRAKILKQMGGTYVNDRSIVMKDFLVKYPHIELIVEAAGIAALDFSLIEMLGINGIMVLTGVPGDQRLNNVDGAGLMRQLVLKNQVVVGSVNASIDHFKRGIQDFQSASKQWPGLLEQLITQRYSFENFEEALNHHSADEIKVIIEWNK